MTRAWRTITGASTRPVGCCWLLLGAAAIVTGLSPTLKEWAYAGFMFDVCGAFASHLSAGDSPLVVLVPVAFFALQLASYLIWKQLAQRSAARRRRHIYELRPSEAELQT